MWWIYFSMYLYVIGGYTRTFSHTYLNNVVSEWLIAPLSIKGMFCWQGSLEYSVPLLASWAKMSIEGHLNFLPETVLLLLVLTPSSHGDATFIPTNSIPTGTIAVSCYTIPCRSTVDVAIHCDRLSTCWGLPDAVYPGNNCSVCTCPTDPAMLNDVGIAHFKDLLITSFLKGNYQNVLNWMLHYPVEQQLTDHVSYVHLVLGMKLLCQAMNKYIKTADAFFIRRN